MNSTFKQNIAKYKYFYFLLIPIMLYYVIFYYLPMFGIVIAFQDYSPFKGFSGSPWVGFKWFATLFKSSDFVRVFFNTLLISIYTLVFYFPAPIILAIMLNECRHALFKKIIQSVSYLPNFISWSIMAGLLVTMLSPVSGIINQIIKLFGHEPVYFMVEPAYTRSLLVISTIWKSVGFDSIIYLAALTAINPELYESAIIDGASKIKRIFYITIPCISNIIVQSNCVEIRKTDESMQNKRHGGKNHMPVLVEEYFFVFIKDIGMFGMVKAVHQEYEEIKSKGDSIIDLDEQIA